MAIRAYIQGQREAKEPVLLNGVCRVCGCDFTTVQGYLRQDGGGSVTEDWLLAIKEGWRAAAEDYEKLLYAGKPVGGIFALKQMGWTDQQQLEISGGLTVSWADLGAELGDLRRRRQGSDEGSVTPNGGGE